MSTFFIGGSQGAGVAALQALLSVDTGCQVLPDTAYFRSLIEAYRAGKQELEQAIRPCFGTSMAFRRFNAELMRRFLASCASRQPETHHQLIKDPALTRHFPELFELLPDARFILVVRDPRDLVAGLLEPDESLRAAGVTHIFQRRRLMPLCRQLRGEYQPALRCELSGFRQRLSVVRYEDLVRKPELVQSRLKSFTGLPLELPPRRSPAAGRGAAMASAAGGGPSPAAPARDGVGRYRQVLSRREASAVAVEMHDFFITFGYA